MIRGRLVREKGFQQSGHGVAIFLLLAAVFLLSPNCKAQDKPAFKIEENITRFAFSPGGRIAYATRHVFSIKNIQLQRDDIWSCEKGCNNPRMLLSGEKFTRGSGPFSYTVRALRWSPDGKRLTAELGTSQMVNDVGDTREGVMTLLLDDAGKQIVIAGADSVIPGAVNATWMADDASVVYLTALQPKPQPPFSEQPPKSDQDIAFLMNRVRPVAGPGSPVFPGVTFAAVAWNATKNAGIAVERDEYAAIPPLPGPARLVALDLARGTSLPLASLEGYAGGLSISPSGKKVAYWIDNEQLEVRDIDAPNRMARVRVAVGTLAWSGDETRALVKRGPALRAGGLAWVALPPLAVVAAGAAPATADAAPQSVLHDLEFRQFDISPDGRSLAVVEPGRRNLLVYPVS
jgi:dipeptidyl aminopeptidase/acylaminoacyl peptidase